jgi:hypothetical protein
MRPPEPQRNLENASLPTEWKKYQEDVAALFRRMGFNAQIEVTMNGARAQHSIDVVVRSRAAGIAVLWIVECKHWKAAVRKEQVMTLGHIAQDVGADRAFLLSESGFQAGAIAACRHSNITLTSLSELADSAKDHIISSRLQFSLKRQADAEEQLRSHLYDSNGQSPRIMAADIGEVTDLLGACFDMHLAITTAMTGRLPVTLCGVLTGEQESFDDLEKLADGVEGQLEEVERRSAALDRSAAHKRLELIADADHLVEQAQNLLDVIDSMSLAQDPKGRLDLLQTACLSSMKRIGNLSANLRESFKGDLLKQVRQLMRILIDEVYPEMITPEHSPARWNEIKDRTRAQVEQVSDFLSRERNIASPEMSARR